MQNLAAQWQISAWEQNLTNLVLNTWKRQDCIFLVSSIWYVPKIQFVFFYLLCLWMCVFVYVYFLVCVWRQEVDFRGLLHPSPPYFFETAALTGLEAQQLSRVTSGMCQGLMSATLALVLQVYTTTPSFLHWFWEYNLRTSFLGNKQFAHCNLLTAPSFQPKLSVCMHPGIRVHWVVGQRESDNRCEPFLVYFPCLLCMCVFAWTCVNMNVFMFVCRCMHGQEVRVLFFRLAFFLIVFETRSFSHSGLGLKH